MKKYLYQISLGITLTIVLLITTGGIAIIGLIDLANISNQLYSYPMAVTRATNNINVNIITMHQYMKDAMIAENDSELNITIEKIDKHEAIVKNEFKILFNCFLEQPQDIQQIYTAFIEWETIRGTIINEIKNGNRVAAQNIVRNDESTQLSSLHGLLDELLVFANTEALELEQVLSVKKEKTVTLLIVLLIIIIIFIFILSMLIIKKINDDQKEIKRYFHTIDQNVFLVSINAIGVVYEVSSALCRFLGIQKGKLLGKKSDFFLDDEVKIKSIWRSIKSGLIWEGEIIRYDEDENPIWIHSSIHPLYDPDFNISGYTNIIHDVTHKKTLEELSFTDKLTSLHNRRYYDEIIEKEIRIARRNELSLTFAILDIDFFKRYNDFYGHPAGDHVLQEVSHVLKKTFRRPNDYAIRFGGEEFALIFSGIDTDKSKELLENLRIEIEALQITHAKNSVSKYLTVSIGAVIKRGREIPNEDIFYSQADQALYKAKEKRNIISLY